MADERRPVGSVAEGTARLLDALLAGTAGGRRCPTERAGARHTASDPIAGGRRGERGAVPDLWSRARGRARRRRGR